MWVHSKSKQSEVTMFDMSAPVSSALRHAYTAVAAATAALTIVGLSQGDATAIGVAVHQIGDGLASIVAGISALVPIIMAAYAAWSGTRKARLLELNKDPEIEKVKTVPGTEAHAEAASIPGTKVS
jgi:D-serine deaminase-like pyridoxal phosphate-dependent protein